MAEGMEGPLLTNGSTESRELIPLLHSNPLDLLPPEIFDRVLSLLDQTSLRQARLVCRKWNNFALQILSKTPGNVAIHFDNGNGMYANGLDRIEMLQSILPFTECPEIFFTKLSLVGESRVDVVGDITIPLNFFQEYESTLKLLQNFGSSLKSLELKYINLKLPILREMFENWCPNLEELTIYWITVTEDNNTTIQNLEASPISLKLLKFKFHDRSRSLVFQNWMFWVVKSSPKLQVLHVKICYGPDDFWKKMQSLPNITKNLEEVEMANYTSGQRISELGFLNDVSFSKKLTSLILTINYATFPTGQLDSFLNKVGESLEKLSLLVSSVEFGVDVPSYRKIEFPLMKRLKFLDLSHGYYLRFFDYIDFRKKLPNIEILRLTYDRQPQFVDALFSNAWNFSMRPHKTLNTMCIKLIQNPDANFVINGAFPNIRQLTLKLEPREIPESSDNSWLTMICIGLAEMKNLKILDLYFYETQTWDRINLQMCFSPLKESESLEELTVSFTREPTPFCRWYPPSSRNFPPSLEEVMTMIPKMKVLTLMHFYIRKPQWDNLFESLGQNGILLKADEHIAYLYRSGML